MCYTMQINDVNSQTVGIALLPNEGRLMLILVLRHCSCAVLASKRSVLCKMGTDLGALYRTFTKVNSIFSIIFEMRRPRTLYKRTFVVEVNCTLTTLHTYHYTPAKTVFSLSGSFKSVDQYAEAASKVCVLFVTSFNLRKAQTNRVGLSFFLTRKIGLFHGDSNG